MKLNKIFLNSPSAKSLTVNIKKKETDFANPLNRCAFCNLPKGAVYALQLLL